MAVDALAPWIISLFVVIVLTVCSVDICVPLEINLI